MYLSMVGTRSYVLHRGLHPRDLVFVFSSWEHLVRSPYPYLAKYHPSEGIYMKNLGSDSSFRTQGKALMKTLQCTCPSVDETLLARLRIVHM